MKNVIISALIFVPLMIFGQVINIPDDYSTIQEGIDAANPGDTVLVQPGIYMENLIIDGKDITLASIFIITNDPNHITETIIDGGEIESVIVMQNLGPTAKLIGFRIQNGSREDGAGGGIRIIGSSPFLRDLLILENYALQGGGILLEGSNLLLLNTRIIENDAFLQGGGIRSANSNLYMENCQISSNTGGSGSAILFTISGDFPEFYSVTLDSCLISSNSATGQTAGTYFRRDGANSFLSVNIKRSSFLLNTAASSGAALQIRGDSVSFDISGSRFMYNSVNEYSAGVAFLQGCTGDVENSVFSDNIAALGGGYWNGGGVTCWASDEVQFKNCTFANNQASYGAGITVGPGSEVFLANCIVWGNANEQIAVLAMNETGGTLYIDYTDIQYGMDSIRVDPFSTLNWGEHNMDEDPLFIGSGDEIYALNNDSPCMDAGPEDTTGMNILPYDILGNVRVWDGDENGSAIIDMGAYEFGAPIYIGITEKPYHHLNGVVISRIYPNPAGNTLNIEYKLPQGDEITCQIFTIHGRLVDAFTFHGSTAGTLTTDVGFLAQGIYLVKLDSQNSFALRKIVVR